MSSSEYSSNSSKVTIECLRADFTGQPPVDRCTLAIFSLKKSIRSCAVGQSPVDAFVLPDAMSVDMDCQCFLGWPDCLLSRRFQKGFSFRCLVLSAWIQASRSHVCFDFRYRRSQRRELRRVHGTHHPSMVQVADVRL